MILKYLSQAIYATLIIFGIFYRSFAIVISLLILTVLGGNFFCGWFCPFGSLQEWLGKLGSKITKKKIRIPYKFNRWIKLFRYLLFILMLAGVWYLYFFNDSYTTFNAIITGNTAYISILSFIILGLFLFAGLFIDRPFCNYLCTEGAQYGLFSIFRIFTIKRDKEKCNSCGLCDKKCPTQVKVSKYSQVRSAHCLNCMECIKICKSKKALSYGLAMPNIKELIHWRKK